MATPATVQKKVEAPWGNKSDGIATPKRTSDQFSNLNRANVFATTETKNDGTGRLRKDQKGDFLIM